MTKASETLIRDMRLENEKEDSQVTAVPREK